MKSIRNGLVYVDGMFKKDFNVIYDETILHILDDKGYAAFCQEHPGHKSIDAKGHYVIPGLIDVHIHGYHGVDTMDGHADAIRTMAKGIAENGVTAFLPTTMTMEKRLIEAALQAIRVTMTDEKTAGAMVLGAHLEGPFINEQFKGAQMSEHIKLPDRALLEAFSDVIQVVTLAPEVPGAMDMIEALKDQFRFSIGHTGATFDQAKKAYEAGAVSATHLFNAMTGLHHRAPGVVGAALLCDCYAEVIADHVHVHPALFQVLEKTKGLDRLLLVTDCIQAGGLTSGAYTLGGQPVEVAKGQCRLADGTIAGSVLRLNHGLENFTKGVCQDLHETIKMVTLNQARYLGVEDQMGTLDPGKLANIVIMDKGFGIQQTLVKGTSVYENQL